MKENIETAFGDVIRGIRYERGYSQERLAHESDLDRTFISHLERGHKQPTLRTLFKLAETLGVAPSEIIAAVERSLKWGRKK